MTRSSPNLSNRPLVIYIGQLVPSANPGRLSADLVSTVVPGNLFTHDENRLVPQHLLLHGGVESLSDGLARVSTSPR